MKYINRVITLWIQLESVEEDSVMLYTILAFEKHVVNRNTGQKTNRESKARREVVTSMH